PRLSARHAWHQKSDRGRKQNGPCRLFRETIPRDRAGISKVSSGARVERADIYTGIGEGGRERRAGEHENEMELRRECARGARLLGSAKAGCRSSPPVLRTGCVSLRRTAYHRWPN